MTKAAQTKIAVVMACFNRSETTKRCLDSLFSQTFKGRLSVYLVDDASPDGTAAKIRSEFPHVHVIEGTGGLYWGGGMYLAMRKANECRHDFFLWLNDDVVLSAGAIDQLLGAEARAKHEGLGRPAIIVGAVTDPDSGRVTYSGFRRTSRWHPARLERVEPDPQKLLRCDSMNGNCALIPGEVVDVIGCNDPKFIQQLGDIDFGYRARRAGFEICVATESVGQCAPNLRNAPRSTSAASHFARIKKLNTPHGLPIGPWLRFLWRFAAPYGPLLLAVSYAKVIFGLSPMRPISSQARSS